MSAPIPFEYVLWMLWKWSVEDHARRAYECVMTRRLITRFYQRYCDLFVDASRLS